MLKPLSLLIIYSVAFGVLITASPLTASAACNIINGKAYGDCAEVTINQGTKGHLTVKGNVYENGIIDGATVRKGGLLEMGGISNGNILIESGGTLKMTGMVNGDIINKGGYVEIEGTAQNVRTNSGLVIIDGTVDGVFGNGRIVYRKGAVVGGVPIE